MLRAPERTFDCPDCHEELRHDSKMHKYVCDTRGCRVLFGTIAVRYTVTNGNGAALSRYSAGWERTETLQLTRESASTSGSAGQRRR